MSIARMRRTDLKNKARRFAAEILFQSEASASGHFDDCTDEERDLVDREMRAIARRLEPEQAFVHQDF